MDPVFDDADSLLEATRFLASIGDKQSFNPLPPVFLNDSPTVSSQQLWANASLPSLPSLPGYQVGPVSAVPPGGELLGAAILSIESHSCPVLLFVDHKVKRITSVVYEAKLAYLEAQLYNFRKQPSALEIKWKGDTFSASHIQLFEMMGEYLKSIGKSFVPAYLLTNDLHGYHLERTGPVPYLHMRTVANENELETVKALILAHISACRVVDATYTPSVYDWSGNADTPLDTTLGYYTFQTLFTKASGTTTDTGTDTTTDTGTTPPPSPDDLAQQIAHVPALAVVMELMINAGPTNDAIRESMKKAIADAAAAPSGPSGQVNMIMAANAPARDTISDLMSLSSRLYSVRNIGHSGGISQAYCLASYMFEPSDVATAIREITNEPSSTRPTQSARYLIKSLAKRVDIAYSVMCIELSSNRYIRSIRLINSETDCELDVDCAGRLLDCPWVFPIGLCVYNRESANFFTLQSTGLARDSLRVCPLLRQAYQLTAILEQPIAKVQAEVDFTALDKRLDSLQKIVTEASAAAASTNTVADLSRLQSANKQLKTIRDPHCNDADSISNCASKRVKGCDASAANSASQ